MLKTIKQGVAPYTHRLEFDVLMKDLTARKIEVNFNGWDEWEEAGCSPLEAAGLMYRFIVRGLDNDTTTLGWKAALFNLEQQRKVTEYEPYAKHGLQ